MISGISSTRSSGWTPRGLRCSVTAILHAEIGKKFFVNPEVCAIIFPHLKNPLRKLQWLTEYALEYTRKLEADGKDPLVVWTIHGRYGHIGHVLVPSFAAALDFHSLVRYAKTRMHSKGQKMLSEAYSPFGHEVDVVEVHGPEVPCRSQGPQRQTAAQVPRVDRRRRSSFALRARGAVRHPGCHQGSRSELGEPRLYSRGLHV